MTHDIDIADRELVASAQGGDRSAFNKLVERHRDQVYGFGLQITRSETNAAEIAQESFLFAYQHLQEFRNEAEFGAWVLRIAGELQWQRLNEPASLSRYSATDWSHLAEEGAMNAELRDVIRDATDRLPPCHREVLLFSDVAGLSYNRIADLSGDTVPAIKRRLHQARLSLHEAIDRFYSSNPQRTLERGPS